MPERKDRTLTGGRGNAPQEDQTLTDISEDEFSEDEFSASTQFFKVDGQQGVWHEIATVTDEGIAEEELLATLSQSFQIESDSEKIAAETISQDKDTRIQESPSPPPVAPPATHEVQRDDTTDWHPGDFIEGRYEVKEVIGRGGMGIVYKVHHWEWALDLAVKMPLPQLVANKSLKARFLKEAETWVNLGLHPNIVQCWYVREFGGIPRVFMDYIQGGSLKQWIKTGRVPPGDWEFILDLIIQACDGLGYAHEHGVEVHRDVKPGNFLLTAEGELRVTDFGIAKRTHQSDVDDDQLHIPVGGTDLTITVTGADLGTPEYGAPEQWGKARHADARADIYALGVVLFELCCGGRPFDDGSHSDPPAALVGRHLFTPAPAPQTFNPAIPDRLADIILHCLAKEPDARPQSMAALRSQLAEVYTWITGKAYGRAIPRATELRSSALNNRAVSLLDLGQKREAFAIFREALELDGHHAEAVYNSSLLEWRAEKIADDEVVRRLAEAKQASRHAGLYLGFVYLERAEADKAEQEFLEALQDYQLARNSTTWRALGDARMAQENYSGAAKAYQQALQLLPGDASTLHRNMLALQQTRRQYDRLLFPWPRCLRTFISPYERPEALALTTDGRFVLLGTHQEIRIWDVMSGNFFWNFTRSENLGLWTLHGYTNTRTSAVISSDGRLAIVGGHTDTRLSLWELATGECLKTFSGHEGAVTAVAMTPDGHWAISGSLDNTFRLWDLTQKECVYVVQGHRLAVQAVAVTADGNLALTGSERVLQAWNLSSGKHVRNFRGHKDDITVITPTGNSQFVLTGSRDKTLRAWNLQNGKCLRIFVGHAGVITMLMITPNQRLAISGSTDKTLRIWNLATGNCLRVFHGHDSEITAAAITPDGKLLVSGSRDKTLRVWSLSSGKCLRVFKSYTYWLEAVTILPDGRTVLVGNNEELRLQDLVTGTYLRAFRRREATGAVEMRPASVSSHPNDHLPLQLKTLPPGESFLTEKLQDQSNVAVPISLDGHFAVSGNPNETLRLWDLLTKQCLWTFKGLKGLQIFKKSRNWMTDMAVTPDNSRAVSGWYDTSVRVWDMQTGACVEILEGHQESVTAVAISADGQYAISGSFDTTLRSWNLTTGKCLGLFEGHSGIVTAVAITADGAFAVSGSIDKTLRLWDLSRGKCLRTFEGHQDSITNVALTADGQFALSLSNNKQMRLWLLEAAVPRYKAALQVCRQRDLLELQIFRERFRKYLHNAKSAKDAGKVATAYTFLTLARSVPGYERDPEALTLNTTLSALLKRKNLREGHLLRILEGHTDAVMAVAVTADGRFFLSGGRDQTVRLWNVATGKCLRVLTRHKGNVSCLAVTPDRHLAISGSWDHTLRLWALATGECLKVFNAHSDYVKAVVITADGRFAISGSSDAALRLWSLATDKYLQDFEGLMAPVEDAYKAAEMATTRSLRILRGHTRDINAVAVSPDGRFVLSGSRDRTLRLWSLRSGKCLQILEGHQDFVTAVAITPDGRFALSGSRDRTLRLWKLRTGKCLRIFKGHEDNISALTITSDGRFAISGSWDHTIRVWKLTQEPCIRVFERHTDCVEALAVTTDNRFVISGSRDTTLHVWELDWGLTPEKSRESGG